MDSRVPIAMGGQSRRLSLAPQSGYLLQGLRIFGDNYLHNVQGSALRPLVLQLSITYELTWQFDWARKIRQVQVGFFAG